MLPFVTTFKSVQVGASSSWQRVGWEWMWVGMLLGGDDGCLLSDVMVRAAAPAKPLVPSALAGSPSCALGLVLWVESAQRVVRCLGQEMSCSGKTVCVCDLNCFPEELQVLVPQELEQRNGHSCLSVSQKVVEKKSVFRPHLQKLGERQRMHF